MNSHVAIGIQAQSTNKTNEIEDCVHVLMWVTLLVFITGLTKNFLV